jgi:hypothetical protein
MSSLLMQLKLVEVLRKTRNRKPDPLARDGQQFIYQVISEGDLLYIGISGSPLLRLRQHYNRPHESEIGKAMRGWAAGYCLDWTCRFYSASGGFQEEHEMIAKLKPSHNIYDLPKPEENLFSPMSSNDEEPPSDF